MILFKNWLANLNRTFQSFRIKQQRVCSDWNFTYFVLNWNLSKDPNGFAEKIDRPVQIKGFIAFRNNNRQHVF